jgi:hypothetical protein
VKSRGSITKSGWVQKSSLVPMETLQRKFLKKIKKVLDKSKNKCYNIIKIRVEGVAVDGSMELL